MPSILHQVLWPAVALTILAAACTVLVAAFLHAMRRQP